MTFPDVRADMHRAPEQVDHRRRLLESPDTSDADFTRLADLALAASDTVGCVQIVKNAEIPSKRRRWLIQQLADTDVSPRWEDWQDFLRDTQSDPLLIAYAIERLAWCAGLDFRWLLAFASTPNLALDVRAAIYRVLWAKAKTIERQTRIPGGVFRALSQIEDAGLVCARALDGRIPKSFEGIVDAEALASIVATLEQAPRENEVFFRGVLAYTIPANAPLSEEHRRLIVEALVRVSCLENRSRMDAVYARIVAHVIHSDTLVQRLVWDSRLPHTVRLHILSFDKSPQNFFQLIQAGVISRRDLSAVKIGTVSLYQLLFRGPRWLRAVVDRDTNPQVAERNWQAIKTTPELASDDLRGLVQLYLDATRPEIIREIAQYLLTHDVHRQAEIFAVLMQVAREGGDSASLRQVILEVADSYFSSTRHKARWSEQLSVTVTDDTIPEEVRRNVLSQIPPEAIRELQSEIWRALRVTRSRSVRSSGLASLCIAYDLPRHDTIVQTIAGLRSATSPEEIDQAEQAWRALLPLEELMSGDPVRLVACLVRESQSPVLLACARQCVKDLRIDGSGRRRLWLYLGSEEGKRVWETKGLPRLMTPLALSGLQLSDLQNVLVRGPKHPYWAPVAALATLPDQGLVAEAFANLYFLPPVTAKEFRRWRTQEASHVPDAGLLSLFRLAGQASRVETLTGNVDRAFQGARTHHSDSHDLLQALISAASQPFGIARRIATTITTCHVAEPSVATARELTRLIRYAQLEARLVVRANRNADIGPRKLATLLRVDPLWNVEQTAQHLHEAVLARLLSHLTPITPRQLSRVLDETIAPAILTAHYLRVLPKGLPLLAQAIAATSEGRDSWENWRFQRQEARAQLPHLDDAGIACWRENLCLPVGLTRIPEDVQKAAAALRGRFQQALQNGEIPIAYRDLIISDRIPERILAYHSLVRECIGPALSGSEVTINVVESRKLPPALMEQLAEAIARDSRQELIGLRARIERSVELLRLLDCDAHALAHNQLRARGESTTERGASAVAHVKHLSTAFRNPLTRALRHAGQAETRELDAAFADAVRILETVKTFAPTKALVAVECSDFKTLIEIGNRPYAQGSCQSYTTDESYNRGLLSYVVDAMIKVIVIRSAPTPDAPMGTPLARSIIRLGFTQTSHEPVIVMEPVYASGGESAKYEEIMHEVVQEFARQRGWKAGTVGTNRTAESTGIVAISASQSEVQYEDGAWEIVEGGNAAFRKGAYAMRVRYF